MWVSDFIGLTIKGDKTQQCRFKYIYSCAAVPHTLTHIFFLSFGCCFVSFTFHFRTRARSRHAIPRQAAPYSRVVPRSDECRRVRCFLVIIYEEKRISPRSFPFSMVRAVHFFPPAPLAPSSPSSLLSVAFRVIARVSLHLASDIFASLSAHCSQCSGSHSVLQLETDIRVLLLVGWYDNDDGGGGDGDGDGDVHGKQFIVVTLNLDAAFFSPSRCRRPRRRLVPVNVLSFTSPPSLCRIQTLGTHTLPRLSLGSLRISRFPYIYTNVNVHSLTRFILPANGLTVNAKMRSKIATLRLCDCHSCQHPHSYPQLIQHP